MQPEPIPILRKVSTPKAKPGWGDIQPETVFLFCFVFMFLYKMFEDLLGVCVCFFAPQKQHKNYTQNVLCIFCVVFVMFLCICFASHSLEATAYPLLIALSILRGSEAKLQFYEPPSSVCFPSRVRSHTFGGISS